MFILLFLHLFYKKVRYIRKANYDCVVVFKIRISQPLYLKEERLNFCKILQRFTLKDINVT